MLSSGSSEYVLDPSREILGVMVLSGLHVSESIGSRELKRRCLKVHSLEIARCESPTMMMSESRGMHNMQIFNDADRDHFLNRWENGDVELCYPSHERMYLSNIVERFSLNIEHTRVAIMSKCDWEDLMTERWESKVVMAPNSKMQIVHAHCDTKVDHDSDSNMLAHALDKLTRTLGSSRSTTFSS